MKAWSLLGAVVLAWLVGFLSGVWLERAELPPPRAAPAGAAGRPCDPLELERLRTELDVLRAALRPGAGGG